VSTNCIFVHLLDNKVFYSSLMHGTNMKTVDAKQAKICYAYKNTRLKLLKIIAAVWFNKMCKIGANLNIFNIL